MRLLAPFLLTLGLSAQLAYASDINTDAKWLAGMKESSSTSLNQKQSQTDNTWEGLENRRLKPMRTFAAEHLSKEQVCDTLFYPFSGPDVLNAVTLFPSCHRYVLFGLEKVGQLPDSSTLSDDQKVLMLKAMTKAQEYLVRRNFFVTQYMSKDLNTSNLNGVVPLAAVMLVRLGYELKDISPANLDGTPFVANPNNKQPKAVHLKFAKPGQADQEIFYASFDASNVGLNSNPAFVTYLANVHPSATLLKAASYLLHTAEFSEMQKIVTSKSTTIVQDDTGVPYSALKTAGFDIALYGEYSKPIDAFNSHYQKDLASGYAGQKQKLPLPFQWSYNWTADGINMQIAHLANAK